MKAYDDVERKVKPVDQVFEYRKQAPLSTERSKEGLAEVYERELLAGANAALATPAADELEREHAATLLGGNSSAAAPFTGSALFSNPTADEARRATVRTQLDALFAKLDALTQLHFTPKLVLPLSFTNFNMRTVLTDTRTKYVASPDSHPHVV